MSVPAQTDSSLRSSQHRRCWEPCIAPTLPLQEVSSATIESVASSSCNLKSFGVVATRKALQVWPALPPCRSLAEPCFRLVPHGCQRPCGKAIPTSLCRSLTPGRVLPSQIFICPIHGFETLTQATEKSLEQSESVCLAWWLWWLGSVYMGWSSKRLLNIVALPIPTKLILVLAQMAFPMQGMLVLKAA